MADIDVTRQSPTTRPVIERTGFRLSWGAIMAGVVIATVLQVMLSVLGLAIGFGIWDSGDTLRGYGVGAAIWVLLTALITLFIGGLVTGRLAGIVTRGDGMLHGLVMWGVSSLLAVWLVASGAGTVLGGAFNVLGRTVAATAGGVVGAAGQVAGAAVGGAGDIDLAAAQREIELALEQSGVPALQPDTLRGAAEEIRGTARTGASNEQVAREIAEDIRQRAGQVDRSAIANVIAARTGMTRPEAERAAERVESAVGVAGERIRRGMDTLAVRTGEVAEGATDTLSSAAWWALIALALSGAAAALGAGMSARE